MKCGEVYWADLLPRSGSEGFNQTTGWMSIIEVPVSSSSPQAKRGPTVVGLPAGAGGLTKARVPLCHQVTTIDRAKLTKRKGGLSLQLLMDVESGLRAAMDLD
jgi:mRNA-degrading endonuclease toxin of MazEF toxin-antitoxin module